MKSYSFLYGIRVMLSRTMIFLTYTNPGNANESDIKFFHNHIYHKSLTRRERSGDLAMANPIYREVIPRVKVIAREVPAGKRCEQTAGC